MRKKVKIKTAVAPDYRYDSVVVAKFINQIMRKGKKNTARRVVYEALDSAAKKTKKEPIALLEQALANASPLVEVRPRRVGGATYQVPREVRIERRMTLAMRWIIRAAKIKKGKPMVEKLAEELIAASKNEGAAVKKKEDTHRMAEANRAFAHFAW